MAGKQNESSLRARTTNWSKVKGADVTCSNFETGSFSRYSWFSG